MEDLRVSFPDPCSEAWQGMTPVERGRMCARCDKVVHDLERYSLDEAEALLRRAPGSCVRARVRCDGVVILRETGRAGTRTILAAAAAAGMLAAGQPAAAKVGGPAGAISGQVNASDSTVRVTATSREGKRFKTKVKHGRFNLRHIPVGTYRLTFVPDCGSRWTLEEVVVRGGETVVPATTGPNECIVVGRLQVDDRRG